MFRGVTVDGTSACVPGEPPQPEAVDEDDEDSEGEPLTSPMSTNSHKRGSTSTVDTCASPAKKNRNAMLRAIRGLTKTIEDGNKGEANTLVQIYNKKEEKKQLDQELAEKEIETALALVKECGCDEDTEEYYVATQLFASN